MSTSCNTGGQQAACFKRQVWSSFLISVSEGSFLATEAFLHPSTRGDQNQPA